MGTVNDSGGEREPGAGLQREAQERQLAGRASSQSRGASSLHGALWLCVETCLAVTARGRGATGIGWVMAWDAAKHPTMHRTALPQRSVQFQLSAVPRGRSPDLGHWAAMGGFKQGKAWAGL